MRLDYRSCDVHSETHTRLVQSAAAVALEEAVEYVFLIFGRNAFALVEHGDNGLLILLGDADLVFPAFKGKLYTVVADVVQYLIYRVAVGAYKHSFGIAVEIDAELLFVYLLLERNKYKPCHFADIEGFHLEFSFARLKLGDVEQSGYKP